MKLILSIVQEDDADNLLKALMEAGYRTTKVSTTGGFLRKGNVTLLVGTEDDTVSRVMSIIRAKSRTRREVHVPMSPVSEPWEEVDLAPFDVQVGGATVFVLDVAEYHRF